MFRWIKRKAKAVYRKIRRQKDQRTNRPVKLDPISYKHRVGLIQPHNNRQQGCVSFDRKYSEYTYFAAMYRKFSKFFYYSNRNAGLTDACNKLAEAGCTMSIEPHLNAFNRKARGYEVLVLKGDTTSAKYAKAWLDHMAGHFPDRVNRGIKYVESGDRGYVNLHKARKAGMKVALLTEAFFADNPTEWVDPEQMAKILEEFIALCE